METADALNTWPQPRLAAAFTVASRWLHQISCALFGHAVDNHRFQAEAPEKTCSCGQAILPEDGTSTRTRHTLSCFFRHHTYLRVGTRDGHNEYMCQQCGHPLLFAVAHDPYASAGNFTKRVRYLCNLFGHRSHVVTERAGQTEYACGCGHTFLRKARGLSLVTHPPICTVLGHFVRFVERRSGYSEHACLNCGHTFVFATPPEPHAVAPFPEAGSGRPEWNS